MREVFDGFDVGHFAIHVCVVVIAARIVAAYSGEDLGDVCWRMVAIFAFVRTFTR